MMNSDCSERSERANTRRRIRKRAAIALIFGVAALLPPAAMGAVTNLGLDTYSNPKVAGNLVAFVVREARQGNSDLNGDGDTADTVLHVYDAAADATTNLALAVDQALISETLVVFTVSEAAQGNSDLNGDGDTGDHVLHVYDATAKTTTNLGLSSYYFALRLDGSRVAFLVYEPQQGNSDLNGDGDANDSVLHLYDATTGIATNLGLATSYPEIDGDLVVFSVREDMHYGTDLNGDGDAKDYVLHVLDAATGITKNLGLSAWGSPDGNLVAVMVSEYAQGGTDFNGDGDAADHVFHVYDFANDVMTNVGLASTNFVLDGGVAAISVSEAAQGNTDLNGNGYATNFVLHIYDASQDSITNLGLDTYDFFTDGNLVAFRVWEKRQGSTDLNGDGDLEDFVLHLYDATTGTTTNLGLAVSRYRIRGTLLVFDVPEDMQNHTDLNGDGDADDSVYFIHDVATGTATNQALTAWSPPVISEDLVGLVVREDSQGASDLNGDGDAEDSVLHLYEIATGATTNMGLAIQSLAIEGDVSAFGVWEAYQANSDLNGDGDADDFVLHVSIGTSIPDLDGLTALIETLVADGVIAEELRTSLLAKIGNAQKSADKDNLCAAVHQIAAFQNQVDAQRGNKIVGADADAIIAYADSVIADLLSRLPPGEDCS